ncbi:MAG TPA: FHA domain-containing protein [Desulfobacteraceae bacterium]|nr:FHA domain-containing protein [Desulfobacteraceae bacterium]
MPTLTLKFKDNIIQEYQINKGSMQIIGRAKDADIHIDNLAVSGRHAKIDSVGDNFLLTDLKSKNGTLVNDSVIASYYLQQNDTIAIGKHTLVFSLGAGEAVLEHAAIDEDKTLVIDVDMRQNMMDRAAAAETGGQQAHGVISLLEGGTGEIKISEKVIKIGKGSFCDIVAKGFFIGKLSATISSSSRPNGCYMNYVGGFARPKVNGNSVRGAVQLKEFDIIQVGSVKMQFDIKT